MMLIAQKLIFGAFWKLHESHLWEAPGGGQQEELWLKFRNYYNLKIYTWRRKQNAAAHAAAAAAAAALATLAHDGAAAIRNAREVVDESIDRDLAVLAHAHNAQRDDQGNH